MQSSPTSKSVIKTFFQKVKLRSLVNLTVFMSFLVILVTSILMFTQQHEAPVAIAHTIVGFGLLLVVFWHLKHQFPSLKNHLKWQQKSRLGSHKNWALVFAFSIILSVTAASYTKQEPFLSVYEWGNTMRATDSASETASITYQKVDKTSESETGIDITIDMRKGPYFFWPQYAFWVEDMQGNFIQPIFVTSAIAKNNFVNKVTKVNKEFVLDSHVVTSKHIQEANVFQGVQESASKDDRMRPESLPVFLHKRGKQTKGGVFVPAGEELIVDAYSGATMTDNFLLQTRLKATQLDQVKIKFEVNNSFDFNKYYSSDRFPDDPIYSGNGYSAQPSLVYEATIDLKQDSANKQKYFPLTLVGHGHHSGKDGNIYPNLEKFTTALQLIDRVIVELN